MLSDRFYLIKYSLTKQATRQEAEIGHLETEVERLKIEHAETLQQMKSNFLKEKANHEHDADHKIKQVLCTVNQEFWYGFFFRKLI